MSKREYEEQAQRNREWQSRFTMCGNFRWHKAEETLRCATGCVDYDD